MRCQTMEVIHSTPVSRIAEGKQPSTGEIVRGGEGGSLRDKSYTSSQSNTICMFPSHTCMQITSSYVVSYTSY